MFDRFSISNWHINKASLQINPACYYEAMALFIVCSLVTVFVCCCFPCCYFSRGSNSISKDTAAKLNVSKYVSRYFGKYITNYLVLVLKIKKISKIFNTIFQDLEQGVNNGSQDKPCNHCGLIEIGEAACDFGKCRVCGRPARR